MSQVAVPVRNAPALAHPKLRAWLRLLATLIIPLGAGGVALLVAQYLGASGRGRSAVFYGVQLLAALAVAQRTYGLRTLGLGRLPGSAALGWSGGLVAAVGSSVVFAVFHFGSGLLFLPVFAADGLAFCALRLRTDSLYPPIAAHGALNFMTAALLISSNVVSDARAIDYVALVVAIDIVFWAECSRFRRRLS